MFRLTVEETKSLVLQIARPKGRGGSQIPPYAFTEQGVAMLSSILKSKRAIHVNIAIMRAFVRLREIMVTHKDLARQIETLERKYNKHDEAIQSIFQAIKQLLTPPKTPKRQIGFKHLI